MMNFRDELVEGKENWDKKYLQGNGKKEFYTMDNVGSSKYTINANDGEQTHGDGSAFFGIETFKNKKKYEAKIKELLKAGYKQR